MTDEAIHSLREEVEKQLVYRQMLQADNRRMRKLIKLMADMDCSLDCDMGTQECMAKRARWLDDAIAVLNDAAEHERLATGHG